ncbi:MAG: 4-hydroxythreonine-4-phosphate dehydrogenase PdxA [Pseudomonadota bacterium]
MPAAPLALTCGEPSGIGPELAAKAWHALRDELVFVWLGDPRHLPEGVTCARITEPHEAHRVMPEAMPVLPVGFDGALTPGRPNPEHAARVIDVIAQAVRLARTGAVAGVCTAPIHKKALQDGAGFVYPGHTEYLAALCEVTHSVMMLASDTLRVVPVTIHTPLADVAKTLTADLLDTTLRIADAGLRQDFGLDRPRLAVAGLNPHAGEGGNMGREEIEIIAPVLDRLRAEGFSLQGPLSADTMFHAPARAEYDAAICMYHDQALIPIKTLDFDGGVNVTLGLPFVRTSPDHGTALDLAGSGRARPDSTIAALRLAARLARTRSAAAT